jgi:hypothetical protein
MIPWHAYTIYSNPKNKKCIQWLKRKCQKSCITARQNPQQTTKTDLVSLLGKQGPDLHANHLRGRLHQ